MQPQVCLHAPDAPRLLPLLLHAVVPWLSCHAHGVRSYAQLVVYALLRRFPPSCPIWAHASGRLSGVPVLSGYWSMKRCGGGDWIKRVHVDSERRVPDACERAWGKRFTGPDGQDPTGPMEGSAGPNRQDPMEGSTG